MKALVSYVVTGLLVGWILPWWAVFPVSAIIPFIFKGGNAQHFFLGLLGVFLAWFSISIYIDLQNDFILSGRIAGMLGIPAGVLPSILSSFIGGLMGGLGALLGGLLKRDYFS